jgi:alpha-beta hydrolase superfamily lysophospholipase
MPDHLVLGCLKGWVKGAKVSFLSAAVMIAGQGCSSPQLGPWHTENLTEEFTAAKAEEIRTFEDYLQLEDAVFQELDEKVYAQTETGPAFALARYSAGSTADPRDDDPDWNRSFEMPAAEAVGGVLLLHGMTDSPYTLRTLGKALNARGYSVLGLRLPGHGTAPSGLKTVTWQDMAAAARLAAVHLGSQIAGKPLHVVGYSTGSALAVNLALDALEGDDVPVPASLVLISPAVGVHPAAALAGLKTGLAALPGLGGLAWLQVVPEFDPYKYNSFATSAGALVHRVTRSVAQRVRERSEASPDNVLPPILVLKSTVDATVSNSAVIDRLLRRLAPDRHELVLFDINRFAVKSKLMVSDPGSFTDQLMADETLPFAVTFITNENPKSTMVVARRKPPFSAQASAAVPLNLAWPDGVISLSHVALPMPPDDPLYGERPPDNDEILFLGQMAFKGERGLLQFPADWLLRLRHNPFYAYLELRVLAWIDDATREIIISSARSAAEDEAAF